MSSIQDQYNSVSTEKFLGCYIRRYNVTFHSSGKYDLIVLIIDDSVSGSILTQVPNIGDTVSFNRGTIKLTGKISSFSEYNPPQKESGEFVLDVYKEGYSGDSKLGTNSQNISNGVKFAEFTYPHKMYRVVVSLDLDITKIINRSLFFSSEVINFSVQNDYLWVDFKNGITQTTPLGAELVFDDSNYIKFINFNSSEYDNSRIYGQIAPNPNKIILPYKTTTSTSSGSTTTPPTTPPVSLPVYNTKLFNCYLQKFDASINSESCVLNLTVAEDPANNITFVPMSLGSTMTFTYGSFTFYGKIMSYNKISAASDAIAKYLVILNGLEGVSNLSDKFFGLTVESVSVSIPAPTTFSSDNSSLNISLLVDVPDTLPAFTAGTKFSWASSSANYFAFTDATYRTYATTSMKTLGGIPIYNIGANLATTVTEKLVYGKSSAASNSGGTGTTTTTTVNGATTTTNIDKYGAGTTTVVQPNTANLPAGTSTKTENVHGLVKTTTVTVTASTITTQTVATFTPTLSTNPNVVKNRQYIGVPNGFNGAIDPMSIFPSVEIYPSSSYTGMVSGMFFGNSPSPTSFDLDPYFTFATINNDGSYNTNNDFRIAVKDGRSTSTNQPTNINLKKQGIESNVRTMGLKGPMYYSGWGYDTKGLPVPNATGFYTSGEYKFHPKTSTLRKLWKTGPIDLRWHNKRKVWVGGPEVLEGFLMTDLVPAGTGNTTPTSAQMKVMRNAKLGGKLENAKPEFITVTNRDPSLSASVNAYIMVIDINDEWRPMWVECG